MIAFFWRTGGGTKVGPRRQKVRKEVTLIQPENPSQKPRRVRARGKRVSGKKRRTSFFNISRGVER